MNIKRGRCPVSSKGSALLINYCTFCGLKFFLFWEFGKRDFRPLGCRIGILHGRKHEPEVDLHCVSGSTGNLSGALSTTDCAKW